MRVLLPLLLVAGMGGCGSDPESVTRNKISNFEMAVNTYRIGNKDWPEGNTEEVVTLLVKGKDKQGKPGYSYLKNPPMDAWDMPLQYQYPPTDGLGVDKPLIWSFGPDGREGTDDDITNKDEDLTRINIANFENAAQLYGMDTNRDGFIDRFLEAQRPVKNWPHGNTEEVVTLLTTRPPRTGPSPYMRGIPMDAWGMPLQYRYPPPDSIGKTDKPWIWSFGPDRREGTDDDITNIDQSAITISHKNWSLVGPVRFVGRPRKYHQSKSNQDQQAEQAEPASDRPDKRGKETPTPQTSVAEKLKKMDQNGDGFIDRSEATGPLIREKFTALDKDGDGRLSRRELKQALVKRKRRKK